MSRKLAIVPFSFIECVDANLSGSEIKLFVFTAVRQIRAYHLYTAMDCQKTTISAIFWDALDANFTRGICYRRFGCKTKLSTCWNSGMRCRFYGKPLVKLRDRFSS